MENFKIEITSEELKNKVNSAISIVIDEFIKRNNVQGVLRESIENVFKDPLSGKESQIREIINDAIENHIHSGVRQALDKTEIKETIAKAIEKICSDENFIQALAKSKSEEIIKQISN